MQMVKRIIGGFFLFILLLWLLAPKEEIYYLLEKTLKKNDIIISNETVKDKWFGLTIQNADIYVKGALMANVSELELNIFFFYNTLKVKGLTTDKVLHKDVPKNVEESSVIYSIVDPLHVKLNAFGSFGAMEGTVELLEKKISLLFPVAKDIKAFRKFLKKSETGEWKYETTY
jgi:hypothetical protein